MPRTTDTTRPRTRSSRVRLVVVALAVALGVGACGIPQDSEPRALAPVLPTPTPAEVPEPECVQPFSIYLVDNATNRLVPVFRPVPLPLVIPDLIDKLTQPVPEEETAAGLATSVPATTTLRPNPEVDTETGRAVIDIAEGFEITGGQLTEALAQLVWTLTESGSIDSVLILQNGERVPWPTDGPDSDRPLSREDYQLFAPLRPPEPQPTTTPVPGCEVPTAEPEAG